MSPTLFPPVRKGQNPISSKLSQAKPQRDFVPGAPGQAGLSLQQSSLLGVFILRDHWLRDPKPVLSFCQLHQDTLQTVNDGRKKLPVNTHDHAHAQGKALGNLSSTQTFLYIFLATVLTFLAVLLCPFTFVPVVGPPPSAVTQQCLCFCAGTDREVQFS